MTDLYYIIASYWDFIVPGCKSLGTLLKDVCTERLKGHKLAFQPISEEIVNIDNNNLAF